MGCCCRKAKVNKDKKPLSGASLDSQTIPKEKLATFLQATVLFSIEDEVQIFYIAPDGDVSSPSHPSDLFIVNLPIGKQTTFIHVNDWVYPLIPGSSPVLKTSYGAYIFPDFLSEHFEGSSVGLILSENLPPETRQQLENVIRSYATLEVEEIQHLHVQHSSGLQESPDTATQISSGITKVSSWIAGGINKAAIKTSSLIALGSEKVKQKTSPAQQKHVMDPRVRDGLVQARNATDGTVQISGHLVNRVGQSTNRLSTTAEKNRQMKEYQLKSTKLVSNADKVAGIAATNLKGTKLEGSSKVLKNDVISRIKTAHGFATKPDKHGKSNLVGLMQVASSGMKGVTTVSASLDSAAKLLGKSLAKETVSIIHHKYGSEAAEVAENSLYVTGNVATTAMNVRKLGTKTTTNEIIKTAGKAVLNDTNQRNILDDMSKPGMPSIKRVGSANL